MDPINLIQKEGRRRGLSYKTIKTYCNCMKTFLKYYKNDPIKISKNNIKEYLDKLLEKNASNSTLNVNLMALKFFTKNILNKNFWIYIKFSKVPKKYPAVLTKQEVQNLINSIRNEKHKLMIELMYSAGLRVSELVMLKVKDLDLKNYYGFVRSGKGNKDRIFIVAQKLVPKIENHIKNNLLESENYIFKGQKYGYYSQRSVQEIVKKAAKKAKIRKDVHCHTLRHCLHPDTRIISNGRIMPISEAVLGEVLSFDLNSLAFKKGRISGRRKHSSNKLLSIWADGYEVNCSSNHRFFTINEGGVCEVFAKNLRIGDYILGVKKIDIEEKSSRTRNFWRFVGYSLGDGTFSRARRGIIISDKDKNMINKYFRIIKREFLKKSKISKSRNIRSYKLAIYSLKILAMMEELGLAVPSKDRRIPRELMNNSEDNIKEFLAGLYDAEGNNGTIRFFSTSKELLKDVQFLLLRLAIDSHLSRRERIVTLPSKKRINHTIFVLSVIHKPDQELFIDKIPTFKKKLKIERGFYGEKIPAQKLINQIYARHITNKNRWKGKICKEILAKGVSSPSRYCRKIVPVRETLKKFLEVFDNYGDCVEIRQIRNLVNSKESKWLKVKKIETIPYRGVLYDLTIFPTECLITDGIISHNSFATHLVEDNYDVATIQSLLGHNSAETTMMYIHMASPKLINVRSPLDNFD